MIVIILIARVAGNRNLDELLYSSVTTNKYRASVFRKFPRLWTISPFRMIPVQEEIIADEYGHTPIGTQNPWVLLAVNP